MSSCLLRLLLFQLFVEVAAVAAVFVEAIAIVAVAVVAATLMLMLEAT